MLAAFRQHTLSAGQAAAQLGLSPSRLYALATAYNPARVRQPQRLWTPGTAGGDHSTAWPPPVLDLLQKRLACSPPCPYSFAAAEALRLHACQLDRAQVRRWALENRLAQHRLNFFQRQFLQSVPICIHAAILSVKNLHGKFSLALERHKFNFV